MKSITVILTCFNRKEKTMQALRSLVEENKEIDFNFIVLDDKSSDGTVEAIKDLGYCVEVIEGTGDLFWCGGMRVGIERYFEKNDGSDCMLVNDDVEFYHGAVEKMVLLLAERENYVIVGATCDKEGKFTYGLRKHRDKRGIYLSYIEPNEDEIFGETMNANCVLIPNAIMKTIGNMDSHYQHSLGDLDLGFEIHRRGYKLISSTEYVGCCEHNSFENTWRDTKLNRMQRLKKKESPKGSPFKEWWYFLRKNYNLSIAVKYSLIPYVRILLSK
ncbi:glycosyltransferase family 2 protein [Clostridium transplantifaecale]|uniref:glycosyltransferase family 2 protein n=1 Tax=Clostridium transplantifaecale TaxID=2479838 RepID=UPI000F63EB99|nr:glycosyltransferase [Clostridium transplantifaecale]